MQNKRSPLVGVLAVQGAFFKHRIKLEEFGISSIEVRTARELEQTDALIIPGGESTTITKVLRKTGLYDPVREFAVHNPVLGTCAGCIMLSSATTGTSDVDPMGIIDITVERNAYGSQLDSFITELDWTGKKTEAVFIRAPKIIETGPEVDVLIRHKGDPVLVKQGLAIACTFHPELSTGTAVHEMFVQSIIKD